MIYNALLIKNQSIMLEKSLKKHFTDSNKQFGSIFKTKTFAKPGDSNKKWYGFSFLLIISFLLFPLLLSAQKHEVSNVSYTVSDESLIIVEYDLLGKDKRYVVELFLKRTGNPRFSYEPQTLMGDVGKGRFSGENRRIIWSPLNDVGEDFTLDPFVDDYYFVIRARRHSSGIGFWSALIIGATAWYFLR